MQNFITISGCRRKMTHLKNCPTICSKEIQAYPGSKWKTSLPIKLLYFYQKQHLSVQTGYTTRKTRNVYVKIGKVLQLTPIIFEGNALEIWHS